MAPRTGVAVMALVLALAQASAYVPGTVHTVFSTECSPYFDWQSIGVAHTHRLVGQPGPITRLSACPPERRDATRDAQIMPTHYHASWEAHPTNNDTYSAYNMAASVVDWMEHATIREEFVVYMDGDMTFRRPIDPAALGVRRGVAVGARYDYLYGLSNGIIDNFGVPNSSLAPHVGGVYILHVDDLRALSARWLHWTERFRTEPHRYWADAGNPEAAARDLPTGDVYVARGSAPWISAMYGYSFAAAELRIRHLLPDDLMLYAGSHWIPEQAHAPPMIVHYGLPILEQGHAYDKQWYRTLDVLQRPCPPRYFLTPRLSAAAALTNASLGLREKLGALITVEALCTLNEALGAYYVRRCGRGLAEGSPELAALLPPECPSRAASAGLAALEVCRDAASDCARHNASSCALDAERARVSCRRTCLACSSHDRANDAPAQRSWWHPLLGRSAGSARQDARAQAERLLSLPRPRAGLAAVDLEVAECELVAARGECSAEGNAARCALSCNGARDARGRRRDDSVHCGTWAQTGQCWHNPQLMAVHCPEACRFDSDPPATADASRTCEADGGAACGEPPLPACADRSPECRQWALRGECDHNPGYMAAGCCTSCAEWRAHHQSAAPRPE